MFRARSPSLGPDCGFPRDKIHATEQQEQHREKLVGAVMMNPNISGIRAMNKEVIPSQMQTIRGASRLKYKAGWMEECIRLSGVGRPHSLVARAEPKLSCHFICCFAILTKLTPDHSALIQSSHSATITLYLCRVLLLSLSLMCMAVFCQSSSFR